MSDVTAIDLIKYASENKPVDFTSTLDTVLGQKALEALTAYKQQLAANLFKDSEEETEEQESEESEEQDINSEEESEESEETGESDDQP